MTAVVKWEKEEAGWYVAQINGHWWQLIKDAHTGWRADNIDRWSVFAADSGDWKSSRREVTRVGTLAKAKAEAVRLSR